MTTDRVKRRIALLIVAWGGAKELLADLHIYGGGILAACGLAALVDFPSVAPLTLGALFLYIGLRR
jgi:hypothetical protein